MPRPKKEGSFKFLNVQMPETLLNDLTKYSEISRIPKTAIVEMALEEFLKKKLKETK